VKRLIALIAISALLWPATAAADDGVSIVSISAEDGAMSVVVSVPGADPTEVEAGDFAVLVDGSRVTAEVFALVQEPMEVVVVVDTSGSMEGEAISAARTAAQEFVTGMPDTASFGVVSFSDSPTVLAPMGSDRATVIEALAGLEADGGTALYDAIITAAGLFSDGEVPRVVVSLTDGADTSSAATLDETVEALAETGIEVRPVALATEESDTGALRSLSTDGTVIAVDGATGLAAAYESVARELTGRYRLMFPGAAGGELTVYVNTPDGVVTAEATLPGSGTVVTPAPGDPSPVVSSPEPAAPTEVVATPGSATPIAVAPTGAAQPWALPAGIALVFGGSAAVMWLMLRGREEYAFDVQPSFPGSEAKPSGLLAGFAGRLRSAGDRFAKRDGDDSELVRSLEHAGLALRPGEFVLASATAVITGVAGGLVLGGVPGAIVFGIASAAAPRVFLRFRTNRRRAAFAEQLEATLSIIAGSIRAGYGLTQAMSTVADESPSPTSEEFNRVVVENRLGRPIESAMRRLSERMDNEDLQWVVEAVEIQHEVGGNLAEILDTVGQTIRDRNRMRRQVEALSAEGKLSAIILVLLPIGIAGFMVMISPDYLAELTTTNLGRVMLVGALALMAAGGAWLKKIVKVEF
jgi:tight adherence protein B